MKVDQQNTCRKIVLTECRLSDNPKSFLIRPYLSILLGASFLVSIPTPSSALTLVANHDAMVDSATSKANYSTTASACISNGASTQQAFAKFDLAALPKDTVITQATLRIFVNRADADSALAVNTVDADWSEQTLTQDNAPTLKPLRSAPLTIATSDTGSYVNYDITALVKAWQANPQSNYGIALTAAGDAQPCNIAIDTKESTGTSHPMEIEVAFEGAKGANGEKGMPGIQGSKGDIGETGAQGPTGLQGLAGADGKDGAQGAQGLPGPQGSPGPMGPQGVLGTQGARGTRGADGPVGPNEISGFEKMTNTYRTSAGDQGIVQVDAICSSEKKVLSGGCTTPTRNVQITSMAPFPNNGGYSCFFERDGSVQFVSSYAICAYVQ
jgi:hypothetical protein